MIKIRPLQDVTLTFTVPQGATIDTICKELEAKLRGEYEIDQEGVTETMKRIQEVRARCGDCTTGLLFKE